MSAARRGADRAPYDYYPTPPWCVDRLLERYSGLLFTDTGKPTQALECCVGDGAIVRACDAWGASRCMTADAVSWTGVELRRDAVRAGTELDHLHEGQDFRVWEPKQRYDIVISNPPFNIAEQIVRRAMTMADAVVMLLRVGFLSSAERASFWREHPRFAMCVLPDRPSFDGEGTDASAYAWFIWGTALSGVSILAPTPSSVRAAQARAAREADSPPSRQTSIFDLTTSTTAGGVSSSPRPRPTAVKRKALHHPPSTPAHGAPSGVIVTEDGWKH